MQVRKRESERLLRGKRSPRSRSSRIALAMCEVLGVLLCTAMSVRLLQATEMCSAVGPALCGSDSHPGVVSLSTLYSSVSSPCAL